MNLLDPMPTTFLGIAIRKFAQIFDIITKSVVIIPTEHHEVHEENHYFIKTWIRNAGVATTKDIFAFTTPDSDVRIHAKARIAPDVDYTINIYEGSEISGGTPVLGLNNDRDSSNVAELRAIAAPVHDTPGFLMWPARTGGGKDPVGVAPGLTYEIMVKRNTTYVFELIKNIAQVGIVDIDFWWYEHSKSTW